MMYSEMTASSLVKIDLDGKVVGQSSSPFSVNKAGWTLHSAIHGARPDVKCIIHLHTPASVAVSFFANMIADTLFAKQKEKDNL